jgi:hypothetical protein
MGLFCDRHVGVRRRVSGLLCWPLSMQDRPTAFLSGKELKSLMSPEYRQCAEFQSSKHFYLQTIDGSTRALSDESALPTIFWLCVLPSTGLASSLGVG